MSVQQWLLRLFEGTESGRLRRSRQERFRGALVASSRNQRVERLEDRCLLASFSVDTTADTVDENPGDGLAADANGNTSLRAAIMEANALGGADSIFIPAGTYAINISGSGENAAATGDLDITEAVTITGAGSDTIIDGANLDRVFDAPNTSNEVVEINSLVIINGNGDFGGGIKNRVDMRLSDVTIENNGATLRGGGVFSTRHLTITNSTIRNNLITRTDGSNGDGDGGGIYHLFGALNLSGSVVEGNRAGDGSGSGGSGGGVYVANTTSVVIADTTIRSNRTGDGPTGGGHGGGIFSTIGDLTITGSQIDDNHTGLRSGTFNADGSGAGIYFSGPGAATVTDSSITNNSTPQRDNGAAGGGLFIGDPLTLTRSVVSGNSADRGGGLFLLFNGHQIVDSTISDNDAVDSLGGGGILGGGTIDLISGSTISGNNAQVGGGINVRKPIGTIVNSTIANNSATTGAGLNVEDDIGQIHNTTIAGNTGHGLYLVNGATISSVANSLLADNTANDLHHLGVVSSVQHTLIESTSGHNFVNGVNGNIVGADPQLIPLADHGGLTQTMALGNGSPAIDAGIDAGGTAIDQRGVSRPFDVPGVTDAVGSDGSDMGAHEQSGILSIHVAAASVSEADGVAATSATITRFGDTANALTVDLSSSDTTEATVPATATIPAGQSSVTVKVDAVDDTFSDGAQNVTITASTSSAAGIDTNFGSGGHVDFPQAQVVQAMAVQPDGKIVVAGLTMIFPQGPQDSDIAVARYLPDGAIDASFGTNGTQIINSWAFYEEVAAIAIQPDGKILIAGNGTGNRPNPFVARLHPDGAFDSTFGSSGIAWLGSSSSYSARAIGMQSDGKILVATGDRVHRVDTDGDWDTSFGFFSNFGAITPVISPASLQVLPDDSFLLAGTANNVVALTKYTSSGSLDQTFGSSGTTDVDLPAQAESGGRRRSSAKRKNRGARKWQPGLWLS